MPHLTPERLTQLLHSQEAARLSPAAHERLKWIAEFVRSGESISEICLRLNVARSTFHRWLNRFDPNNLSTLEEQSHTPRETRSSNVSPEIIAFIREYRKASPLLGKELLREKLLSDHNVCLSASTIGRIIEQECLYFASTPLHWKKRMKHQSRAEHAEDKHAAVQVTQIVREEIAEEPVQLVTEKIDHECLWCDFWKSHGRTLRRTLGFASIAINIAIVGLYLATAFWEQRSGESMSANIQLHQTGTVSNLDAPPFNEQ